jgi:hypothetical protein
MRDFTILIDGSVPLCGETAGAETPVLGNAFSEAPDEIWKRGDAAYREHCGGVYARAMKECLECDEYYTYNF